MKSNSALAAAFAVLAVVFAAAAVFFFVVRTNFLANSTAVHYKHGIVFTALAVLALVAANFARPKPVIR